MPRARYSPSKPRSWPRAICLCILSVPALAWSTELSRWAVDTTECALNIPQPLQPHGRFGCPVPIDESASSRPSSWSPWTHHPHCTNSTGGGPHAKFCVFTNSHHGIRGLSMITTPQTAADSVDILNEPILPSELPGSGNTWNASAPPLYEIVNIPGKGKGVVATRRIEKYETIMVDYASILVDMYFPHVSAAGRGVRPASQRGGPACRPN